MPWSSLISIRHNNNLINSPSNTSITRRPYTFRILRIHSRTKRQISFLKNDLGVDVFVAGNCAARIKLAFDLCSETDASSGDCSTLVEKKEHQRSTRKHTKVVWRRHRECRDDFAIHGDGMVVFSGRSIVGD